MGTREVEQDSNSTLPESEVEEDSENKPTGDTDDEVVEEVPPPPQDGQCVQNVEQAIPRREQEDERMEDERGAVDGAL